ncbi:ABC transporter permease [Pseudonocardia ailaonensis]|uniref:ABC transporter permease n=1 Tax=Pseudonocardia ailaonensis TaxID=367279 RepID=A0ABN2N0D4_9PSEU
MTIVTTETEAPQPVQPAGRRRRDSGLLASTPFIVFSRILLGGLVLGLWQLAASLQWVSPTFVGSPLGTVEALVEFADSGKLVTQSAATLGALFLSLLIAVPLGTLVGLLLANNRFLDRVVSPFLIPVNSLPRLAFAPLFLLWFGLTIWSKVALASSLIFFIMIFNTRAGVRNVDPDMMEVATLLGLSSRSVLRKVSLPFAVPSVVAGVRLSVTYGLLGVIGSEMIAARDGMGVSIVTSANALNTNGIFAVLVVLAAIATLLGIITGLLEKWLLRWQ